MRPRPSRRAYLSIALCGLAAVVFQQVHTPRRVEWERADLPGCAAAKAEGLVLQEEAPGAVWATQGYDVYKSTREGPFERVFSIRPPLGEAWGGYSRSLRRLFGYQELAEVVPLREDVLLVFAAGRVYRVDSRAGTQDEVLRLRYFGRGKGRGVMSRIAIDDRGRIDFGEYPTTTEAHSVRLWRSDDEGRSWQTAFELAAGKARHIHGVQWDPYGRSLWMMTGDEDAEVHLGWSIDGGEHFTWIGEGEQRFRACGLLFAPDAVLWGTDTFDNHLMRWTRSTGAVDVLTAMPGQSLYAQGLDGTTGLVGQSTSDAALYLARADGTLLALARFSPDNEPGKPLPGVRLARGEDPSSAFIYFNPLRTREEEAAIYRMALANAASCTPPAAPRARVVE